MNNLQVIISIFLCIFYTASSWSNKQIKNYELPSDIKTIRIQVSSSSVNVRALKNEKNKTNIQYPMSLDVIQEGSVLVISDKSFLSKKKISKIKKAKITIRVPSLPIEVAIIGGSVNIHNLKVNNLSVSMLGHGSIDIKNTKGTLNVFQNTGNINIYSHIGDIDIQAENSRVLLKSCKGKININSLKGTVTLYKSQGHASIYSFKAPLVFDNFVGSVFFRQEKGGVYLKKIKGSVSGYSNSGKISGSIKPNQVNIETKTGVIHLVFSLVKAWVTAETWEGRIYAPAYFHRIKTGGMDRLKGRLRGSFGRGMVSLKSYSGSIYVLQK